MLSVRNLVKTYKLGKNKKSKKVVALNNVSLDFPDKGLVFLLGKSGSGKSTLLNAIGGLDTFDSGEIIIKGKSSKTFKQSDFDSYRNTFIGFIFQEYNILDEFTVGKNLSLALELQGKNADRESVENLLKQVDLEGYYKRKPNQLSGGQKQRVAIARALIKDPEIIMADEPTGALDSNTGKQVMDTLKKLSETKLVIIVSHDREFAEIYGDRVIELKDGKVIKDDTKGVKVAQKTATGVSFIGDKIIHIKKGQQITQADLLAINRMIVAKSKQEETFISFDDNTNETVKKTAFITDDGNREVFEQTKPEDIKRKNHDPKDFKLIKSKLKQKDAFKVGVSSLKHKPIRLIFTILLACVAFCLFGLVDTLASFNEAESVYQTVNKLQEKILTVAKQDKSTDYENDMQMLDDDINSLNKKYEGYSFQPVFGSGSSYSVQKIVFNANQYYDPSLPESKDNPSGWYGYEYISLNTSKSAAKNPLRSTASISGFMGLNADTLTKYNLQLTHGRMPEKQTLTEGKEGYDERRNAKEILISHNIANSIIDNSEEKYKTFEEIVNGDTVFQISIGDENEYFKVVGIIKDDTDISKYENLTEETRGDIMQMMYNSEYQVILSYGLVNMCYMLPEDFAEISGNYRNDYYYRYETDNHSYGFYYSSTEDIKNYILSKSNDGTYNGQSYRDIMFKNGYSAGLMTNDDIVIRIYENDVYDLAVFDCATIEELMVKINEGLTMPIRKSWDGRIIKTFNVVGISYDGIFLKDEVLDELYGGYDYAISRFTGTNTDRSIIKSIYSSKDANGFGFGIKFKSTPIFDNFGGMIDSLTKPFLYIGLGLAVFAGFMLMNFISTSISYKQREIGILRAIGARGKDVFSIFFSESFVICIINFLLAVVGCGIASYFINQSVLVDLGINVTFLSFGIRQVILMFGVSLLVALVSTFLPVYRIAKKNPIDSINNR